MYMKGRRPRSLPVAATIVVSLSVLSAGCATGSQTARASTSATPTTEPSAAGSSSAPASQPPASSSTEAAEPAEPLKDGSAVLVSCPSPSDPRATVKVTNPNGRDGTFALKISFLYAQGSRMDKIRNPVWVPAKDTTTYRVRVTTAGLVDTLERCVVEPRAAATG
ncbi:hypothetical protein ABZ869_23900 [Streptomyces sp. NPDC046928]|uniref:hypothetical protein n=1 Tax=Streptomyces sp. NPDC046928 TaxID=3155021 RepID=UPI0033CB0961